MGIKIEHAVNKPNGWSIKLDGIRTKFYAKEFFQLELALKHYYNRPHDKTHCPLCNDTT